ncbi:rifin [Plasmodium sp.]|nr:rifin [Plasmodium sp.]
MLLCLFLVNKLLILLLLSPLLLSCRQFQSNGYMSTHIRFFTKITISRTLSEYDKYKNNYDDPEMKEIMKRYNERTAVRIKEYDQRKKEKHKKNTEKYDKDIKDIIVKDKIQKQLTKQLSALEKVTDIEDLLKDKNEKKVATKGKKGSNKSKKTLGQTLSEWNILPNIDMYEWIPFNSNEAKIDGNIKNMKDALTKVGYIGPNKFESYGSKGRKVDTDLGSSINSIMSSSNALIQKYMDKDATSHGGNLKKKKGAFSFFLWALWETLEHIVLPAVAPTIFGHSHSDEGHTSCVKKCDTVCKGESTCCCAGAKTCCCASANACCCASAKACCCASAKACCCACTQACCCTCTQVCCCACTQVCCCACTQVCCCACAQACCCACMQACCCACMQACCCACTQACCCTGVSAAVSACKCAHELSFFDKVHCFMKSAEVFVDAIFAIYMIVSISLIIYYVLKYYREVRRDKKLKYMKILK